MGQALRMLPLWQAMGQVLRVLLLPQANGTLLRRNKCCFPDKQLGHVLCITSITSVASVTTKRVSVTIVTRVRSLVRRFGLAVRR